MKRTAHGAKSSLGAVPSGIRVYTDLTVISPIRLIRERILLVLFIVLS
jgi:hypothetical protein